MTELEHLEQQRDEIDRRIKELRRYWRSGNAKVFPTPGAKKNEKYSVHVGVYHLWTRITKEEMYTRLSSLQTDIGEVLRRMDAERLGGIETETEGEK